VFLVAVSTTAKLSQEEVYEAMQTLKRAVKKVALKHRARWHIYTKEEK
jgi:hypothetical protein